MVVSLARTTRLRRVIAAPGVLVALALSVSLGACQAPVDHASAAAGARITGPINASGSRGRTNCAIDGDATDYGPSHGYAWAYLHKPTVITLAGPVEINAVEIVLSDVYMQTYCYRVSLSTDGEKWVEVADQTATPISGWRLHTFEPTVASHLRLDFTSTSVETGSYHIVEVGAYRLPAGAKTGPLGNAFARAQFARESLRPRLLGIEAAQRALDDQAMLRETMRLPEDGRIHRVLDDGTGALFYRDGSTILAAIDDDGNMLPDAAGPDGVNDCLAISGMRDGRFDRTIDYTDTDGDGDADVMVQTYTTYSTWGRRPFMVLVVDLDDGPLRLWKLHNYGYWQSECQWGSDFAGDGYFVMFRRNHADDAWTATFEAPFCFYNGDDDAYPEETVRLTATGTTLHSARYSVNADNDVTEGKLYDYDVGITCLGRPEAPEDAQTTFTHRSGDQAGPFVAWDKARETVRGLDWARALLVWDENDHNVAQRDGGEERWEGILNSAYRSFPQEGGPPCGVPNKRFELDADYSGRMQVYYWPADARMHLFGAEVGTLRIDYDYDGVYDMRIEYSDTDGDGFFDRREIDYAGGPSARTITGPTRYGLTDTDAAEVVMTFDYAGMAKFWPGELHRHVEQTAGLLAQLAATADALRVDIPAGPMDFYRNATEREFAYIDRLRASTEARRYYQDISVEMAFGSLMQACEQSDAGKWAGRLKRARRLWDMGSPLRAAEELTRIQPTDR